MDEMQQRRRLDRVLDEDFASVEDLALDEVRERRQIAIDVENELSYYRRLLHGRSDLVSFEIRRRSGEETRSLIDALPTILSDQLRSGTEGTPGSRRPVIIDMPLIPQVGSRPIDHLLADDVLTRLDELSDDELREAVDAIAEIEHGISQARQQVQIVVDRLTEALTERYRSEEDASAVGESSGS